MGNTGWKKWLLIDKRFPKSNYILRAFVGVYLIYIIGNIGFGLSEPEVTNVPLIIAAMVVLSVLDLLCIISGGYGLWKKEYREMYQEEEENKEENNKIS
jgi:hypothetical protein